MKISNIRKTFGDFSLQVEHIDFSAPKIYGIIGHNGCGKTTLAKIISGIMQPDEGTIDLCGISRQDITIIPKRPYMLHKSVLQNLVYPLKIRKTAPDSTTVESYLQLAGLDKMRKSYARDLSGGETQKLGMIRAFIFSPKFIIVDEAFSNMDMESQITFENQIAEIHRQKSTTFVIISHDLAIVKRLCAHIYFLEKGKIAAEGNVEQIFNENQNEDLGKFLKYMT